MVGSAVVVEDDANTAFALTKAISAMGYSVRVAGTLKEAKELMHDDPPDVVLLDITLPDGDGLDLLTDNASYKDARFVIVTGDSTQQVAVRSLRSRASDFLTKPVSMTQLQTAVKNIAPKHASNDEQAMPVSEAESLARALRSAARDANCNRSDLLLAGKSKKATSLDQLIQRFALSKTNVMVKGEAGVDKLAAAFALHRRTPQAGAVYLIRCATGHVVTSSNHLVAGFSECLSMAFSSHSEENRVTLVLDDVSALSVARQRELMTYLGSAGVLESHTAELPRIIAIERHVSRGVTNNAINRKAPGTEVKSGCKNSKAQLLDDLKLCLDQCELRIPSLRHRREDITAITRKILSALNAEHGSKRIIEDEQLELLLTREWPGNLRELSNVISKAFHTSDYALDIASALPAPDDNHDELVTVMDSLVGKTFWEVEKSLLKATLASHDGDKKTTAKSLGISLKTLYNRINAYSL